MSIPVTPKRRGRPATGRDPARSVRLSADLESRVSAYADANKVTRSEAIRTLIEGSLMAPDLANALERYEREAQALDNVLSLEVSPENLALQRQAIAEHRRYLAQVAEEIRQLLDGGTHFYRPD